MKVPHLPISRRTLAMAAGMIATVSLAIGAHAALNMRALDAAKAVATDLGSESTRKVSRIALIIGNGHYPDAVTPLTQPINDARALSASLRRDGFDVDVVEDANKYDMTRAVDRLRGKIRSDSIVMLFFGGYGVQVGRESYMIPVDAVIWKEADVRHEGRHAVIRGVPRLSGAPVRALDVRAGAALVLAGLAADGETTVFDPWHVERGYPDLAATLSALGANVQRVRDGA